MPINQGKANNYNVVLQSLANLEPRDAFEAPLVTQATVLHARGMHYLSMSNSRLKELQDNSNFFVAGLIESHNIQLRCAMKLLRLSNETIEALCKYRPGGKQKVIVQHVNVEGGSQAIVNNGDMIAGGVKIKKFELFNLKIKNGLCFVKPVY